MLYLRSTSRFILISLAEHVNENETLSDLI
jgi:hypothetical protein